MVNTATRIITPMNSGDKTYRINGVTYHVRARFDKDYDSSRKNSIRERMQCCLLSDKNLLTQVMENDIIPAGTVYSAAEKEVTA